jgi:KDO2-lipid IV(A) lauroyltransferase
MKHALLPRSMAAPNFPRRPSRGGDVREGGRWRTGQWLKNTLIYWVIRALVRIVDRMDPAKLERWGRRLGRCAYAFSSRARKRARINIRLALPGADATALAKQCFVNLGANLALCLLLRRDGVRALDFVQIDAPTRQLLETTLRDGPGAVFVSAHLGPFELLAAAVSEFGLSPAVVVRQSYDPRLDPIIDAHRTRRGIQVLPRGSPETPARMLRALREGRPVGFLIDLPARVPSLETPFLGRRRAIPFGPQLVAQRARVPLLVGTLAPPSDTRHRFRLQLQRLDVEGRNPRSLTRCVTESLARAILTMPAHWPWMSAEHRNA